MSLLCVRCYGDSRMSLLCIALVKVKTRTAEIPLGRIVPMERIAKSFRFGLGETIVRDVHATLNLLRWSILAGNVESSLPL